MALDAFLLDDGWDDRTGRWLLARRSATVLAKSGKSRQPAQLGWAVAFSVGGYNKPRDIRVSHAKEYGFETVDGKLALSGPNYFKTLTIRSLS